MGRVVYGAKCLWGEISEGDLSIGRVSMGRLVWESNLIPGEQIEQYGFDIRYHKPWTPTFRILFEVIN
jgi:hypothetical protein